MRAYIEYNDDFQPFTLLDVYENEVITRTYAVKTRPLPWSMEFDSIPDMEDMHEEQ
jgi:hypothetical protein